MSLVEFYNLQLVLTNKVMDHSLLKLNKLVNKFGLWIEGYITQPTNIVRFAIMCNGWGLDGSEMQ
jgi:hypothetical protein